MQASAVDALKSAARSYCQRVKYGDADDRWYDILPVNLTADSLWGCFCDVLNTLFVPS